MPLGDTHLRSGGGSVNFDVVTHTRGPAIDGHRRGIHVVAVTGHHHDGVSAGRSGQIGVRIDSIVIDKVVLCL